MEIFKLNEEIKFNGQERIFIDTNSEKNILEIARKNNNIKNKYKELLRNDYVLSLHKDNISHFCKRNKVYKLFTKAHRFNQYKDVLYRLNEPSGRKINEKATKKLLVIFAKMPGAEQYDSAKIPHRMIPPFFEDIERSLAKNVYTMRIMDLNVSHGSHYINTVNYSNYENEIQEAIIHVQEKLGIEQKNVILYGVSRGGAGAIYHGSDMDYKTLAVDPIINIGGKLYGNDRRILKDLRKEDLVPDINNNLEKSNKFQKVIICSENVEAYYEQSLRLNSDKVNIINMKDDMITAHPKVSPNTVPEQLMILNMLLSDFKVQSN
ncbi:accessory Sec system protein Asp2 [Mammaliicoccus sciuri]|uniref:accessory Sec system protein Asp2 n=1 Tax=Mammaliicoccus sciuri TaxID=1296 RepID=UPI003A90748A